MRGGGPARRQRHRGAACTERYKVKSLTSARVLLWMHGTGVRVWCVRAQSMLEQSFLAFRLQDVARTSLITLSSPRVSGDSEYHVC